jgi:flagellar hook-basal body complex protein FliE
MKTSMDNNQLLQQLQQLSKLAQQGATKTSSVAQPSAEFGSVLSKAIDTVNAAQQESASLARQVEAGDGGVSLVKAMIASQKASVAFQATLQVRNKVVSAYQDIMNMPI